ncbi:MAG: metal ABC transporter permease [Clostridia bacterium]|nr:metal ABC transporter permease [Clostridia bacterium]
MQNLYWLIENIFPFEWTRYDFMKNAFLATLLIGILFGFLGSMVVNQKMAFFSEALGHSALTGIGIGAVLGVSNSLVSMILFAIFMSLAIWFVEKKNTMSTDTIIGTISSIAIALGLVLMSQGGNFNKYSSYLIGDVLSITTNEIVMLFVTLIATIAFWSILFNKLVLAGVNSAIANSRKIKSDWINLIFIVLVAVVVMISIKWVGILIINSLLILPAATARNVARNMKQYTLLSVIFSVVSCLLGLVLSYYIDAAAGATIVLVSSVFFVISLFGLRWNQ